MRARVQALLVAGGLAGAVLAGGGCRRARAPEPPALAPAPRPQPPVAAPKLAPAQASAKPQPPARPLRRCFPEAPSWVDAPVADLLDRTATLFDAGDFEGALACAEEAARQAPRSVEAHHDRGVALMHLDRLDEARDAITLALSLAPDDPETLEAIADLYINQLPPSADRSAIGLELARRGSRHAPRRDGERVGRLALLEGQALIDLGRSAEALRRLDVAIARAPRLVAAQYERGVALFELCRFPEARRMFARVVAAAPDHGHALYHLALLDERDGDDVSAARRLAEATARDPKSFPPAPQVSVERFADMVRRAVAALPADIAADLASVRVETAELPALEDLTAERPPLSPTILGLFRGAPLGYRAEQVTAPALSAGRTAKGRTSAAAPNAGDTSPSVQCARDDRTIVLYRRNILRTVRSEAEARDAVTKTLLHEIGHLRGEDDGSLRDRGLE